MPKNKTCQKTSSITRCLHTSSDLDKNPHKQGPGSYTVTTTPDTNRQTTTADIHRQPTTQNNTGLEQDRTPKRPGLQDQTPQPSTSTITNTSHNK